MKKESGAVQVLPRGVEGAIQAVADHPVRLEDLTAQDLEKLLRMVTVDKLKDEARRRVDLKGIDYQKERLAFVARAERKSVHTAKSYRSALARAEAYCARHGFELLELTPARAAR